MSSLWKRAGGTVLALAVFGGALWFGTRDHAQEQQAEAVRQVERARDEVQALNGQVSVDVEPFFADERVQRILRERSLPVKVTRVGSRDMADRLVAGPVADFYFPSGVLAARQITDAAQRQGVNLSQAAPFNSPMVVASWAPIARMLAANGMARTLGGRSYTLQMDALVPAMLAHKRWIDLQGADAFAVKRGILVSTTDVRKSNSAAMYLALTSHAVLGDVVSGREQARSTALQLAPLFKRQGYQENYVNGNFDDYVQIGMGKAPLAFIYEHQIVGHAVRHKGVQPDMVLMYPEPTIVNKFVFLTGSARGRALMAELSSNRALLQIAAEYGLRGPDGGVFMAAVRPTGLEVPERIVQMVDPPSHELMSEMVDVVSQEMSK